MVAGGVASVQYVAYAPTIQSLHQGRGMKKLRVQNTAKKNIYIHNDTSSTVHHLKTRIEEMEATVNRHGIFL